jgi:hypothetical protein
MENIYKIFEQQKPNFFQRLFKQEPKENAFIELNNLLAKKNLKEIRIEQIEEISSKYKVDLRLKFLDRLKELYERYLKKCFADNVLTDEELEDLNLLKHLLLLKDLEINELHNKLGGDIYKKNYEEAISKGTLEKSKEEFIDKLQQNLKLPDSVANKISSESRNQFMDIQLGKIVEDGKISPEEWEELNAIAKNLNVDLKIDEGSKSKLERMKLYWLIENGELPTKQVDINLQKSEQCYFTIYADWLENRTVTQRINYGGVGYRVKIMKGVYYRAGSVKVQRITSEQLLLIDTGKVYITNKRIIFVGNKKNSNIQLNKVLSVSPYIDGVGIEKDSGKSPILRVTENADVLAMTLGRMLNELQNN